MSGITPLGQNWKTVREQLLAGRSGVRFMSDWSEIDRLRTRVGAPVPDFQVPEHYPRKKLRSMGRLARMAARASELALLDAGLLESPLLTDGSMGLAYGSAYGSAPAIETFAGKVYENKTTRGLSGREYFQWMGHTAPANLMQFFEIRGRTIPTSSACTSGSQGIGYGYETIASGKQKLMLTGGAEELSATIAVVFDCLLAASTANDAPGSTPRPFDAKRDGIVIGEGAATLVLERLEHAVARGVRIHATIEGFGTNSDGQHMTNPDPASMERVMRLALEDAGIDPKVVGYISAHATGTDVGDVAESIATHAVFGENVPISSLKGHLGHTLGACGSIEAWLAIEMMREGWFAPTLNLDVLDPRCAKLDYIMGEPREIETEWIMSNNFAFGGVNTSLIFRRWPSSGREAGNGKDGPSCPTSN